VIECICHPHLPPCLLHFDAMTEVERRVVWHRLGLRPPPDRALEQATKQQARRRRALYAANLDVRKAG
jgi:hypothetical protein